MEAFNLLNNAIQVISSQPNVVNRHGVLLGLLQLWKKGKCNCKQPKINKMKL